jgi:hypothetical protein
MAVERNPHQSQRWGFFVSPPYRTSPSPCVTVAKVFSLEYGSELDTPHTLSGVLHRRDVGGAARHGMAGPVGTLQGREG